jgi:hypothetical protein
MSDNEHCSFGLERKACMGIYILLIIKKRMDEII